MCASGEIENVVAVIGSSIRNCTVVFYDGMPDSAKIEALSMECGAIRHRVVTISSVLRSEG